MPLEYDSHTSETRYEGKVVGRYDHKDGKARVSLNLTYECAPEERVVPLSWFAYGLSHLAKHHLQEYAKQLGGIDRACSRVGTKNEEARKACQSEESAVEVEAV